jgi:hypothetical protein
VTISGSTARIPFVHPDHEEAFDRLTETLDPYHEFLRFGSVTAQVDNPDEWRAEIRCQARRDKIPMRSVVAGRTPDGLHYVWAGRSSGIDHDTMGEIMVLLDRQREATERATLLGHDKIRWVRVLRGEEAAGRCLRCGARLYVRSGSSPVTDGEVFELDCA